ncbi:TenA family protein [Streptomyces sp. NPDC090493]|uniref:TenA family protein n=1 Tax=Streptomyces sp. NPDC090493 TaxID=3365964 RepID=UPI003819E075
MTFVDDCRERSKAVWNAYRHHPWIEALADGTLRPEQFVFFQTDDGAHVAEFNRTIALGIAKAPVGHPWAKAAANVLANMSTVDELGEKQSLIEDLGFPAVMGHDRWSTSPAREGYVNHLVRTGLEGTFPHIAASLYPCSLFTEVIGSRFRGVRIPGPEPYRRWADMYTRRTRTEMCAAHAAVMEDAADAGGRAGRESLFRLYKRSLEHQVRVFDAAWALDGMWPGGGRTRAAEAIGLRPRPAPTGPGAR